jgi:hypothetical protein
MRPGISDYETPLINFMENNPELKTYLDAVSKRIAYNHKTGVVNIAIILQLQEDVARIIEMVRVCEVALCDIDTIGETYGEELQGLNAADMYRRAAHARLKIAELAKDGSHAHWGDFEGLSKNKPTTEDDEDDYN